MTIHFTPASQPAGKVADAELHFTDGPLAGLKLIGFSIWERRRGVGRTVTFPARQYSVNGADHRLALLRPCATDSDHARLDLTDQILTAYAEQEAAS